MQRAYDCIKSTIYRCNWERVMQVHEACININKCITLLPSENLDGLIVTNHPVIGVPRDKAPRPRPQEILLATTAVH